MLIFTIKTIELTSNSSNRTKTRTLITDITLDICTKIFKQINILIYRRNNSAKRLWMDGFNLKAAKLTIVWPYWTAGSPCSITISS